MRKVTLRENLRVVPVLGAPVLWDAMLTRQQFGTRFWFHEHVVFDFLQLHLEQLGWTRNSCCHCWRFVCGCQICCQLEINQKSTKV